MRTNFALVPAVVVFTACGGAPRPPESAVEHQQNSGGA